MAWQTDTGLASPADTSSRDTGSDYGQFDRAVSQAANNPPAATSSGSDHSHSRFDVGSGYYGEPVTTTSTGDDGGDTSLGHSLHGGREFKLTPSQKRDEINEILRRKTVWDKNKWKRDAVTIGGLLLFPPTSIIGGYNFIKKQEKKVEERKAQIKDDLRRLEALGYEPHPWEERGEGYGIKGDLEFELFKLENPNWNKGPDDDKGDGPGVVPITEEIEAYEDMAANPMSLLNMRDNKALYAALSEKWEKQRREKEQEYKDYGLLPDNAVDNTAVGAITMQANSGGLANLFRVKNQ